MEASATAVESQNGTDPAPDEEAAEHSPAESRDSSQLFEFARYVHVGPGADDCPDADNGKCSNTLHFHAWIRLPNPFQRAAIAEKATAARARRKRQLRDEESDSRVILDEAIETMVEADDKGPLVEELVNKDFLTDHLAAMRAISEEEGYEHIEEDQERHRALLDLPDEERPAEEWEELAKHVAEFSEKVNADRDERQRPLRDSLTERSIDDLADLVRDQRIDGIAQAAFMESYNVWEWYIGTLKPRDPAKGLPVERIFGSIDHLKACAPEIYNALDSAFTRLEAEQGQAAKNS